MRAIAIDQYDGLAADGFRPADRAHAFARFGLYINRFRIEAK